MKSNPKEKPQNFQYYEKYKYTKGYISNWQQIWDKQTQYKKKKNYENQFDHRM